jgi:structure-specific recognition protein 1
MRVVSKTDAADHVFSALPKEEMESIGQFLKSKNIRLKNELDDVMDIDPISDDDDDDEDMSIPSEDEQKGKKNKSGAPAASRRDEDEDESGESDVSGAEVPTLTVQRMKISTTSHLMADLLRKAILMRNRMLHQTPVIQ